MPQTYTGRPADVLVGDAFSLSLGYVEGFGNSIHHHIVVDLALVEKLLYRVVITKNGISLFVGFR